MLNHQLGFSNAVEEIYKPIAGVVSDADSAPPEGNTKGIQACAQYCAVVKDLQETLQPELDLIEKRIIAPTDDLLKVIKAIEKIATKRDRKQLDLDRHTGSLTKIQAKQDRSAKDEKALYTAENDVELATQEYDYYNNMLKEELPQLFHLESEFIQPLFLNFYYMQLNIYYTLYNRMEQMKIPYFDLKTDLITSFEAKRGDIQEQAEALGITKFRIGHYKAQHEATKAKAAAAKESAPHNGINADVPPSYQSSTSTPTAGAAAVPVGDVKQDMKSPELPSPVVQGSGKSGVEYCVATYDYAGQAQGDLTFKIGDVIEIVQRTSDPNGWWKGKLKGTEGVFPGTYVHMK